MKRYIPCKRCAEIRAAKPEDLILFFSPLMATPHWRLVAEGERVRSLALAKHAAIGHPE